MSAEVIRISDYRVVDQRTPQPSLRSTCVVVPLFRSAEAATTSLSSDAIDDDKLAGRGRDAG